jgi:hypothetical protein
MIPLLYALGLVRHTIPVGFESQWLNPLTGINTVPEPDQRELD